MPDAVWLLWSLLLLSCFVVVLRKHQAQRRREREWREHVVRRLRDE